MTVYRCQLSVCVDSVEPADRIMITPHFENTTPSGGHITFLDDLMTRYTTYIGSPHSANEMSAKLYNAEDTTPPNYPVAEKTIRAGVASAATVNREICCCLSYYATLNRPRHRGRLYVCSALANLGVSGARPAAGVQTKVGALADALAAAGGSEYTWVVWSRVDLVGRPVTNWWVDNSWDQQRRRGVKPTSRLQGTVTG